MVKRIILIVAIAMIAFSGVAFAGDSAPVTVSANVTGTCKFNFTTTTLDFGSIDPSNTTDAQAQTVETFWCTKGTLVTAINLTNGLNYGSGSRNMIGPGGALIPYTITATPDATTGLGKGTSIDLTIDGLIANANYINATAGSYLDTVTLTITP